MNIRSFQSADAGQVISLWERVFDYSSGRNDPRASLKRKVDEDDGLLFVADEQGMIVGTIMGGYDGHRGWIYSLAVDELHRRQGIATKLLQHVEQIPMKQGCPKINLQILSADAALMKFYESLGYQIEERISMGKKLI